MTADPDPSVVGDLEVAPGATWADLAEPLRALLGITRAGWSGSASAGPPLAPAPTALVVATSGSSGSPKRVRLPAAALRASGEATAERLGGHGRWVLALPSHHVAGLQVLARSALAGTEPVCLDPEAPFSPTALAEAVHRLGDDTGQLRLTSLVPTQLHRSLADQAATAALTTLDAVLLGGAAADPGLLQRARSAGVTVITTYGMSETCGGCVYDGRPLPGVQVQVAPDDGRVRLGGPVVAAGYLDAPALTAERFVEEAGTRWFLTDDRGRLEADPDGRTMLRILGRVDDVITTGGLKVEPRDVEEALRQLPWVEDAVVVGLPDPEWGQRVAALVVPADPEAGEPADLLDRARHGLRTLLPAHALPRTAAATGALPLRGPGKPDRPAAARILGSGAAE